MTNEQMRVELPELPRPDKIEQDMDVNLGRVEYRYFCEDATTAYATAAILADRERRTAKDAGAGDGFPHEEVDAVNAARYKIVDSDTSVFGHKAIAIGDGTQQVYHGRNGDCAAVAAQLRRAFADGAFWMYERFAATQQAEPSAGSGPWHRLVKVPLNLTEPPVYKDRWVPCMSDAPGAEPMPAFVQELRKLPDLSEEDVQVLIAMVHAGHDYAANLASKEATPSAASPELIAAARAVVARWHSPKWKDEAPTAEFIQRLERALPPNVVSQKPVEVDDNPWLPHNGGPCPVAPDALVDVKHRNGVTCRGITAGPLRWDHWGTMGDIIEYCLHREGNKS